MSDVAVSIEILLKDFCVHIESSPDRYCHSYLDMALFTCNYVFFVRRGFLFLWVLGMGYVFYCGTP